MIVPPVGWLKAMRDACRELDILFVVDEVITGFGRTGPMFACEAEGVEPDLMTVAKGLTAGYAPMGAMLMSERSTRASPTARDAAAPIGHGAHLFGASGQRRDRRSKCCGSITKAACSPTASRGRRASRTGSTRCSRIRWSAMRVTAACSARSNSVSDKATQARLRSVARPARPHLLLPRIENGLVFRAFGDNILGFAPALCYTEERFRH